jgi:Flp pilus assembly protein TadD
VPGPGAASIALEHGIVLAAAGRRDAAVSAFRDALAADPNNTAAALEVAWLLIAAPGPDAMGEALGLARRAAAARPRDPSALGVRAAPAPRAGNLADAATAGRRALELGQAWNDAGWTARLTQRVEGWERGQAASVLHRDDASRH